MSRVDTELPVPITSRRSRVGVGTLGYATFECVEIVTNHRTVNHDAIADLADLVGDACQAVTRLAPHVFSFGAPALVPVGEAEAVVAQVG